MTQELVKQSLVPAFNFFDKEQFEVMQRVCKMFANSELVPEMYRVSDKNSLDKAMANCMIAIEVSQRIGASPLLVMQNLIIIYGKPSWSSKFLISTVNTCGKFSELEYKFTNKGKLGKVEYTVYDKTWIAGANGAKGHYDTKARKEVFDGTQIDNIECIAYASPRGKDKVLESSPISVKMAIQEGWYTKAGSKWPNMTQQMLIYRTASFWTNAYAPELSMGMRTVEEIQDTIDIPYEEVKDTEKEIKDNANKQPLKKNPLTTEETTTQEQPAEDKQKDKPKETKDTSVKENDSAPKEQDSKPTTSESDATKEGTKTDNVKETKIPPAMKPGSLFHEEGKEKENNQFKGGF